jgi:hypothetical protein
MNKEKGGYEIKVREMKDGQIVESYKKLTDLSSEQLKATLEAEKNKPQDIETVQRNQLNIQESMLATLKEINEKILRGITGNQTALTNLSKVSKTVRDGGRNIAGQYFNEDYVKRMEEYQKELAGAKDEAGRKKVLADVESYLKSTGGQLLESFKGAAKDLGGGKLPFSNQIDNFLKLFETETGKKRKTEPVLKKRGTITTTEPTINNDFLFGRNKAAENVATGKVGATGGGVNVNETIEVKPISGKIDINVTATGADSKIIEEILSKGSVTLKERIFEIVTEQSKITPGRIR